MNKLKMNRRKQKNKSRNNKISFIEHIKKQKYLYAF